MIVTYSNECDVFQSSEHNLVYIPILKNAHTWAEKFISKNFDMNFSLRKTNKNYESLLKDKITIVILRDPWLRWLSGITQYFIHSESVNFLDDSVFQKTIKDVICFDEHTTLQLPNLIGVDKNNAVFFKCDRNLESNMNLFSKFWFNKEAVSVGTHQVMNENPDKVKIYNKIKEIVKNDNELHERIQHYYAMDYGLISDVSHRFFDNKTIAYYNTLKAKYD